MFLFSKIYIFVYKNEFMIKIGLSGNRFSGKKRVIKLFKQIGVPVFDADIILKFILNYNYEINYKIRSTFGDVFSKKGDLLDIGKFKNDKEFNDLIDVIEYELLNAYEVFNIKNSNSIYTIFYSSILYEREWQKIMDYNINVYCSPEERISRCLKDQKIKDDGKMETYWVKQLMATEMSDIVKNSLANFTISNYKAAYNIYGDLCDQVNSIDQKIIDDYLLNEQTEIIRNHYGDETINPELI